MNAKKSRELDWKLAPRFADIFGGDVIVVGQRT